MSITESIICIINAQLKDKLGVTDADYFGLAEYMLQKQDDQTTYKVPGIFADNGELQYVGFDDVRALRLYHRISAPIGYTVAPNTGRGSSYGDDVRTDTISLIVMANRDLLKINPDRLEYSVAAALPQKLSGAELTGLDATGVKLTKLQSNIDSYTIFNQEFGMQKEALRNLIIIEVKYKLDITLRCTRPCIKLSNN